ncbi:MAG: hypothetical protein ACLFRD_07300 [Nitriliruptoraceae bacterium]
MRGREDGFVAGAEALVFGVLIFVIGTLTMLTGWVAVDAKLATSAAAREAVRAVVDAPLDASTPQLEGRASRAAQQVLAAHGHGPVDARLEVADPPLRLERCHRIAITVGVEVTSVIVPGTLDTPRWTVSSRHEQVVDPFRSGLALERWDGCGF